MQIDNAEEHYMQPPTVEMGRSTFRRNFGILTTFNAGQLIPIWVDQDVMAGDTISCDVANVTRLSTPLNPTMDNCRIDYYAYAVPKRLVWKHFKEFMGENTTGTWTQTTDFEIPQLKVRWLKHLGGSKPIYLTLVLNETGAIMHSYAGSGAGLRDAVVQMMARENPSSDYAYRNCLTGFYFPLSLLDYMGIPDLSYNIPAPSTAQYQYNQLGAIQFTGQAQISGKTYIAVSIYLNGARLMQYGWDQNKEESESETNIEALIKTLNDLMEAYVLDQGSNAVIEKEISALPLRAYQLIYDNAFRNQNYIEPKLIDDYNGDATMTIGSEPYRGGFPEKVNRTADYFSTCLPEPQKGDAVLTPLGTEAPVVTANSRNTIYTNNALAWARKDGSLITGETGSLALGTTSTGGRTGLGTSTTLSQSNDNIVPANLIADLKDAVAATINAQRLAFAVQRIEERDARGGTRFPEVIRAHYGVDVRNDVIQLPEYLGGEKIPINIDQINQTSETGSTPLGDTGANSLTSFAKQTFTKSFVEPSIVMILAAVRTDRTYGQGINRDWFKKKRLDFYYPTLAFLGEQPVYNREIFCDGSSTDDEVWGYQERWQEMRMGYKITTGAMRVTYAESLDVWHYGDKYENLPILSKGWLQEDEKRIDRTLAVSSRLSNQFISDWAINCEYTRVMPIYSIPGLIDHY